MNTSELTCLALDWAVAKCEDKEVMCCGAGLSAYLVYIPKRSAYKIWRPSTNWVQGGPIIERERIQVSPVIDTPDDGWTAHKHDHLFLEDGTECFSRGDTPLIAAMRCYVASKLGDTVEIPEELK